MAYNYSLWMEFAAARVYVEGVLGYKFANEDLLREAIQAAPTYSGGLVLPQANRPLAMVGDKAMDLILVSSGYKSGFSLKGINATRVIAENKNIAAAVDGKGLQKCITLNQGTFWDNPPQAYLLATAVEAILGALYLDSGDNLTVVKKGMASLGLIVGENGGDGHVAVAPGSTFDEAVREAADGALV